MKNLLLIAAIAGIVLAGCKGDETTSEPQPLEPSITNFAPLQAQHGAEITITGANFSATPSANSVTFNNVAATVVSASATQLKVTVPKNLDCSGLIRVTVAGKTAASTANFTYIPTAVVTTFAGSGEEGFADGTGTAAKFNYPNGVAVSASGTIYVADFNNHRIRRITPAGVVTTFAGSEQGFAEGTGTAAKFNMPSNLAIHSLDTVYVADWANDRIRKITPTGVVSTLAGSTNGFAEGTGNEAKFDNPSDVAIDALGNIYVADTHNNRIRKITSAGVVTTFAGSGTAGSTDATGTAARFDRPSGIAIDASGNIYVADYGNHRIRKITDAGAVSTLAGSTQGLAEGAGAAAKFDRPLGVAVDASGNVYVADERNHRIRKITPAGVVSTLAGSTEGFADGNGAAAKFNYPSGVAVDASGNLYVADGANSRIRKIVME